MSRRLSAFAATILAGCLAIVGLPAMGAEPVDDFVGLPFTTYGDMLVDSARGQVFVTGGAGTNEIAVVSLDGSGVTTIPNAPGATKMSMAQDGRHVYVTLPGNDSIAEIDTVTLALRRIATGTGSCPTEVAAVAGYVWFVATDGSGCSELAKIRRLDPVAGTVPPDLEVSGVREPVLHVVPGTTRLLYVETGLSRSEVAIYDVADGTLNRTSIGEIGGATDTVRLTNDGAHLMVGRYGYVAFYRLRDFAADGINKVSEDGPPPSAYAADHDVVAAASWPDQVDLLNRGRDGVVDSLVFGPSRAGVVKGLELVGDRLFAVTLGGSARLYQVHHPAASPPSPDLTLNVPHEAFVGRPVTVSGVLTSQGTPIGGAVVTVRQDGLEQPVGSATTDPDGRYSLEFVPPAAGTMYLSAKYVGDASVAAVARRTTLYVVRRPVTLALAGPASVSPGDAVKLSGTVFEASEPVAGADLRIERRCLDTSTWESVATVATDAGGGFAVTDTPGSCDPYQYVARYAGDDQRTGGTATSVVEVSWVKPSIDLRTPWSVRVDKPLTVAGTLRTADGPLANTQVVAEVSTPSGTRDLGTLTTDATGWFSTTDVPTIAGPHCYVVRHPGDSRTLGTSAEGCVGVYKRPTALTLSTPSYVELGDAQVLTGRLTSNGEALGGTALAVTRTDSFRGTETLPPVDTGADGGFTIRDTPPNGGDVTYTVSYAGSATQAAASRSLDVVVYRSARTLELRPDRAAYGYGQTAELFVDLTTDASRDARVFAQEVGGDRTLIFSGEVPASGLTLQYPMTRNMTFSAEVHEDERAHAAYASVDRTTRAGLTAKALGGYRTSGRYRLFRPSADPRFAATISPEKRNTCIYFLVQRRYSDGWRAPSAASCAIIGDRSTATWKLTGRQATRTPYRVRAMFQGDDLNAPTNSAWIYFKFV